MERAMPFLITARQTVSAACQSGLDEGQLTLSGIAVITHAKPVLEHLHHLCGLQDVPWISPLVHPYTTLEIVRRGQYEGLSITVAVPPIGASPLACAIEDLVACGVEAVFLVCAAWSLGPPVQFGDLIVPAFCVGSDGASLHYSIRPGYVSANPSVVDALATACQARGATVHIGGNGSCEVLYRITRRMAESFRQRRCLSVDNGEASTLFAACRVLGVPGGVLFQPYIDLEQGWDPTYLHDERYVAACRLQAEAVLDAALQLQEQRILRSQQ